ncbi:MAG: bifunctional oligoribonuclease/PAP phosphatase NrnA [bacterium]|nr:bifunctional oligoribonuclease/PAP phosphatase NrnA [bacterium]
MNKFKQIYKQIKKYKKIVIARHIGADPDALGSSLGLKEAILNTFPSKEVYCVGTPASRHKYIGNLDRFEESMYNDSLLIVLDTPNISRIDGVDVKKFKYVIKIDHHPFIEEFGNIELIDDTASSASQLVIELIKETKLKLNLSGAEKLYVGIIGDTNRFLYYYTTSKTFSLVSYLMESTNLDFTKLYENMYLKSIDDLKFQSYIINNINITQEGLGYINLDQSILDEFNIDASTATNVVNNLTYIKEMYSWVIFAYDKVNDNIRASIRSRGPIINDIASKYNGGGHIYAAGARLKSIEEVEALISDLNDACSNFKRDNI